VINLVYLFIFNILQSITFFGSYLGKPLPFAQSMIVPLILFRGTKTISHALERAKISIVSQEPNRREPVTRLSDRQPLIVSL
jgi:hypothetical protein